MINTSNNRKNLDQNLSEHYNEILYSWNTLPAKGGTQAILHYLFPSLLVQMCGFIEQKYDSLLWEYGYLNPHNRYALLDERKYRCGSIDLKTYKDFFIEMLKFEMPQKNSNMTCSLYDLVADQYNLIAPNKNALLENLTFFPEIQYFLRFCRNKISSDDASNILKATIDKRNQTAHFKNFYGTSNIASFVELDSQDKKKSRTGSINLHYFESYYLLIALDEVINQIIATSSLAQ